MKAFMNFYKCEACKTEWYDTWSCARNSKCLKCNAETTPYETEALEHPEKDVMRESLVKLLRRNATGAALFTVELETLADYVLDWMEMHAEPVEHLFNPDRQDGLQAVPLKWTTDKGEESDEA